MHIEMEQAYLITAREQDIPAIAALEQEAFSCPWTPGMILGELRNPNAQLLLLVLGEQLLGYVGMQLILDECYITNLAVKKEWQGRGLGSSLLQAAERGALEKGCFLITLEVRESNEPALKLYRKHGFETAGRRKNYYEKPVEDALIMTKSV